MFISDHETVTDMLQYESIAKTVVKLIRDNPSSPITIGVHGDWGAGKSSVLKMTQAAFDESDGTLCIWFNGWTFEGFEDAKTVVLETIVEELKKARPTSEKVKAAAKRLFKRIDWLKVAKKGAGLAFSVATGMPPISQIGDLLGAAKTALGKDINELTKKDVEEFAEGAFGNFKNAEEDNVPAHIHAFRKEFAELLDAAEIKRLIVMVDDLDRCLPATAIGTLEAIRLFLFVDHTAFVIGADELMIEYAVKEHFPDLPSTGPVSYARNYLEKLIQVPFRIPALGAAETRTYITLLLVEAELGAGDAGFQKLLAAAREDMRRPWLSEGINPKMVTAAMGPDGPQRVDQAMVLAGQLTEMLAEGTKGNPRQIKRFLNSMLLRKEIGEARGFGGEISVKTLAKLMLAERFRADFFDEVAGEASTSVDGHSQRLALLEKLAVAPAESVETAPAKPGTLHKAKPVDAAEDEAIDPWLKTDWIRTWATLEPPLAGIDLRPYVFVTRDKRMLLGRGGSPSPIGQLFDELMGTALQAKRAADATNGLAAQAVEDLFDTVKLRILEGDAFATRPPGIYGLLGLTKAHPQLERRLLDFCKELPISKLGAWAPASMSAAFSDVKLQSEFRGVVKTWSEQTENPTLSRASKLIDQVGKK